ncbi:protein kinase domain-containing protein [Streptomyces milbemycinicus]|uniref:protein kinase domain-containing protein n=1 Tax=Streptomyces milbemycinicus TaxID=476552 RepID=UPI0033CC8F86
MTQWRIGEVIDGRYEVTRVHEQGAMGLVHRVRHLRWDTDLAVKSPRADVFQDAAGRAQFVAEAEAWVSLGLHPHVCGCFYVRTMDGVPRVFAEYVDGGSLRDWIVDRRLYEGGPPAVLARILDLAVQAARGLEHAHGKGLVHQDVKPANILVGDGIAKVTDFGLARAGARAPAATPSVAPGASLLVTVGGLTPAYASPEQAMGRPVGRRSDIFSLAVSVLEMFVGEITWAAGSIAGESLAGLREDGECAVPLPGPVADLLARCLAVEPADRPGSMAEVAGDLAGLYEQLTGSPYPRPAPVAAELRADELNNRALSLLDLGRAPEAEAAFAQAAAADPHHPAATYNAGLLRWRSGELTDEQLVAALEAAREAANGSSPTDASSARYLLAQVHLERGDLTAARALLEELDDEQPGDPDVGRALRTITASQVTDARDLSTREVPWQTFPFSRMTERDRVGKAIRIRLGHDGTAALTGSWDGSVRLWELSSGACVRTIRAHDGPVRSVDLSRDGRTAVSFGADHALRFWNLTDGTCRYETRIAPTPRGGGGLTDVRLTPGGRAVVCGTPEGAVVGLNMTGGTLRASSPSGRTDEPMYAVEVSPDGRHALAGGTSGTLHLVDLADGTSRQLQGGDRSFVWSLCFSADGRRALSGHSRSIHLWDLESGTCLRTLKAPLHGVESLAMSADGRYALSGAQDFAVRYWDLTTGCCVRTFRGQRGTVSAVWLSPDGCHGVSAAQDNTVTSWELPSRYTAPPQLSRPLPPTELNTLGGQVDALVNEAEQALADSDLPRALDRLTRARSTPGYERAPHVLAGWWRLHGRATRVRLRSGWLARELTGHTAYVTRLDLSADGRLAASASADRTIRLWDVESGACTGILEGHAHLVEEISLSPDGQRLLSLGRDRRARLWDVTDGACLRELGPDAYGNAIRLLPDGRHALIGGRGRQLRLWDLEADRQMRTLEGFDLSINAVGTSADGRLAISGGDDKTVRLWDLDSGRCLRTMTGHARAVRSVWLSPDGRHALSGGDHQERTVRLWDTTTGACLKTFATYTSSGARLIANGPFVVCDKSGGIEIWDAHTGQGTLRLDAKGQGIAAVTPTPDGRHVLSGDFDGTVRVWELDWELSVDGRG